MRSSGAGHFVRPSSTFACLHAAGGMDGAQWQLTKGCAVQSTNRRVLAGLRLGVVVAVLGVGGLVRASVLDPKRDGPALDVGCGKGAEALFLARMAPSPFRSSRLCRGGDRLPQRLADRVRLGAGSVLHQQLRRGPGRARPTNRSSPAAYSARMVHLVRTGGLLVIWDRWRPDWPESALRRGLLGLAEGP